MQTLSKKQLRESFEKVLEDLPGNAENLLISISCDNGDYSHASEGVFSLESAFYQIESLGHTVFKTLSSND